MNIRYRGAFSYEKERQRAKYKLFDIINNKSEDVVYVKGTEEECFRQYGLAQKEYYTTYPRLLPKGISVTKDNCIANFSLQFTRLDRKTLYIGSYITIQEAIQAKRDFIAYNIE